LRALDSGEACSASLLQLHASVRPPDGRLLARCLEALSGKINRSSPTEDVTLAATELLADNYAASDEALAQVCAAGLPPETLMLVLAEGWPDSQQLKETLEQARRDELSTLREYVVRVRVAVDQPGDVLKELQLFIPYLATAGRNVDRAVPAVLRRLRRDPEVVQELERSTFANRLPSETASFARLLALANPLSTATREHLADIAEGVYSGENAIHVGYDIVAGRQRPLAMSLFDALSGA